MAQGVKPRLRAAPNRFDLAELGGAFGDVGTLIPFLVGYVAVLGMQPTGLLLGFGLASIGVGVFFRTPLPVQPMKAVAAIALTQTAGGALLTSSTVIAAGLVSGVFWLLMAGTGWGRVLARLIPKPVLIGIVMGLGFGFMREGIGLMSQNLWLSAVLLALALFLSGRSRVPVMFVLLAVGVLVALVQQPQLREGLAAVRPELRLPDFAWPSLSWSDCWQGVIFLALPQVPLTFGNGVMALVEENNRQFPERPTTIGRVAFSTGAMNVLAGLIGGVPMCHGAGGLAAQVRFGARSGGAPIILGGLLIVIGVFFGASVLTLCKLFPPPVLGTLLFLAGAELALGGRTQDGERGARFVVLTTAAVALWHVGGAMLFGCALHYAAKRGWVRY